LKYRPDIDGLRALAVVPVVFYHLGTNWVPGGFVGVDIFFVISGFLITGLLAAEIDAGDYSVARFYVRRARRIFPALFFMCLCYAGFALVYYLPNEVEAFRQSLLATTLFVSNIHFYLTQDYFGAAANTKPLLHTWSLAVEEQFYIVFPLLLFLLRRRAPAAERWILLAMAGASLAVSIHLSDADPTAAFYLPHSRAWELLIGSLLAVGGLPVVRKPVVAEVLALIGLALIAFSLLEYGRRTPFPGVAALAPCIGAALIIHTGSQVSTMTSRVLAFAPVRFIGLISYSLYLWHWPIDVGLRLFVQPLSQLNKIEAVVASFIAATLSWKFVEAPFRRGSSRIAQRPALVAAGAAMMALLLVAVVLHPFSIRRWDLSPAEQKVLALQDQHFGSFMREGTCFLTADIDDFAQYDRATCLRLSTTQKNFLLIGDSHAADLWPGLARVNTEVNLMQATSSGCKPVINSVGSRRCTALMQYIFRDFLPTTTHLDAILLSARWLSEDLPDAKATAAALTRYADKVVILGPAVEYQHPLPRTVTVSLATGDPSLVARDLALEVAATDRLFRRQLADSGALYFSIYDALCPKSHCQVLDSEGMPLEFDTDHFTLNGSVYVAQRIQESGVLGLPRTMAAKVIEKVAGR
jgi:peptidoglycan/LPS O-acetylase OafA/YrhL